MYLKLFLDVGSNAGDLIKSAIDHIKANPGATPSALAAVILTSAKTWQPSHKGKHILTPALRAKLAGALADLAYNIRAAETGKDMV